MDIILITIHMDSAQCLYIHGILSSLKPALLEHTICLLQPLLKKSCNQTVLNSSVMLFTLDEDLTLWSFSFLQ